MRSAEVKLTDRSSGHTIHPYATLGEATTCHQVAGLGGSRFVLSIVPFVQ